MIAMAEDPKNIPEEFNELETPAIIPQQKPTLPHGATASASDTVLPLDPGNTLHHEMQQEVSDLGLVRPASPLPKASPAPEPKPTTVADLRVQSDIQKILNAVKLPERRGPQPERKPDKQIPVTPITEHLDTPPQVTPEPEKPVVTPLHTLKDDIQTVVRVNKISLVRAASLEEDRKMKEEQQQDSTPAKVQRRSRTTTILFASALLVFLGLAAIGGVVLVMSTQQLPGQSAGTDSIIFSEQNFSLPIDHTSPMSLKQQIAQFQSGEDRTLNAITRITPTVSSTTADGATISRAATTQEFLRALGANIPDNLARSLGREFFFGIHSIGKRVPVFVIPVVSYDTAFAGMLTWEKTMNADLAPVFTAVPAYRTDQNGIPQERLFADTVIHNYDVRALFDDTNQIVLYYSFPSPQFLIIAENPYTFNEVIPRLRAQRKL